MANNGVEIGVKFKNSVTQAKKIEEYAKTLAKINGLLGGLSKNQEVAKNVNQISNQTKDTSDSISKMAKQVGIAFNFGVVTKFANALGKAYKSMWRYSTVASDFYENWNLFQVAYRGETELISAENVKNAKEFTDSLTKMYGLDESWGYRTVGIFKQLGNAMGLASETATQMTEILSQMSLDVSSLFNVDIDRASSVLQSALAGQTKPIRGLTGADITQATLQTTLDKLGIDKAIADLSYAEKRLIIILSLTDQLSNAFNDMSKTIESPANQTRVLASQWERLTRAIGNVFLPILARVLPYLNAIMMVLTDIINLIADIMADIFKFDKTQFTDTGVVDMSDMFDDMADSMDGASDSAKKLKQGLRGFDKLNNITTPTDTGKGTVGAGGISSDILDAFNNAYAKYKAGLEEIEMKATKIANKIRDWLGFTDGTYKNLKLIGAIIGTIIGLKVIKGLTGIITGTSTLGKILAKSTIVKSLTNFVNLIKKMGLKGGLAKIFSDAVAKIKIFLPVALKVSTVLASIVAVILGSKGIYEAMKKLVLGTENSNKEWQKYIISMTGVVAGATAIGGILGGPLGAIIGSITGLVVGLTSAWLGTDSALTKIAKSEVFGKLNVSQQEWLKILSQSTTKVEDFSTKMENMRNELNSHNASFENATSSLELFAYKYGKLGMQMSEEDTPKILEAIQTMGDEATNIINTTTETNFELWSNNFSKMSVLTEEEEKNILNSIMNYGNQQKSEIANAQENITKTYNEAIQTRGYLTDEEYKYISEQLAKIREVTENEMTRNQANVEYYKAFFSDKNLKLDEESYKNFNSALKQFTKEQKDIIEKNYQEELQSAKSYYDSGVVNQEEYNKMIKSANKKRTEEEKKLKTELKEIKNGVYEDLANHYAQLEAKTDASSKKQRKIIEGIFKGINVDKSDITKQFASAGESAGKTCAESIGKGFNSKKLKLQYDISEIASGSANVKSSGGFKASWEYAKGGLPPVGQIFIANERGPELIGNIGGQSFVANQNQMLDLLDKKIGNATSSKPQTYNIYVGTEKISTVVLKDLNRLAKIEGRPIEINA